MSGIVTAIRYFAAWVFLGYVVAMLMERSLPSLSETMLGMMALLGAYAAGRAIVCVGWIILFWKPGK